MTPQPETNEPWAEYAGWRAPKENPYAVEESANGYKDAASHFSAEKALDRERTLLERFKGKAVAFSLGSEDFWGKILQEEEKELQAMSA